MLWRMTKLKQNGLFAWLGMANQMFSMFKTTDFILGACYFVDSLMLSGLESGVLYNGG
jgi:hypothetical protein